MLADQAERLKEARQMGFSCDMEGLPRDPRVRGLQSTEVQDVISKPQNNKQFIFLSGNHLGQALTGSVLCSSWKDKRLNLTRFFVLPPRSGRSMPSCLFSSGT